MRETKLASKVIEELRTKHNCFVINIAGSQFQQPGLPDCLIIAEGQHIFVEFKGPETLVKKHQEIIQKRLKESGAKVHEVRFLEDKRWIIDWHYQIQFSVFRDGVKLMLDTLRKI